MTVILGLDPSFASTGWAIIDIDTKRNVLASWGTITTDAKHPIEDRLRRLHDGILEVTLRLIDGGYQAALETPFVGHNPDVAIKLGMAQAACLLAITAPGAGLFGVQRYTPAKVKKTITGNGRSDKAAVRAAVVARMGLDKTPSSFDASDAMAVAYTHYLHLDPQVF